MRTNQRSVKPRSRHPSIAMTAFGPESPSETTVEGCNTSKCNKSMSPSVRMIKHRRIPMFGWSSFQQVGIQTHLKTSEPRRLYFNLCLQWCIVVFGSTGAHCEPKKNPFYHKQERSRRSVGRGLTDRGLTDRQLYWCFWSGSLTLIIYSNFNFLMFVFYRKLTVERNGGI